MSDSSSDDLIELAQLHRDYWEGSVTAKVIDRLIANNDLEQLEAVLKKSSARMFEDEYNPQ